VFWSQWLCLRLQVLPFQPSTQEHLKSASPSMQDPLFSQGSEAHSLRPAIKNTRKEAHEKTPKLTAHILRLAVAAPSTEYREMWSEEHFVFRLGFHRGVNSLNYKNPRRAIDFSFYMDTIPRYMHVVSKTRRPISPQVSNKREEREKRSTCGDLFD
jgi:hypothetical protein